MSEPVSLLRRVAGRREVPVQSASSPLHCRGSQAHAPAISDPVIDLDNVRGSGCTVSLLETRKASLPTRSLST